MQFFVLGSLTGALLGWLMGSLSLFLILLILIQRGKGGGLTGALGGPGGQTAFGSKAGDTFTVITIVVASIWGFTCAFTMWLLGTHTPSVTLNETNLSPSRSEQKRDAASDILIPSPGIELDGGIGGIGPASDEVDGDGESSSMELTPAEPEKTEAGDASDTDTDTDTGDAGTKTSESKTSTDEESADEPTQSESESSESLQSEPGDSETGAPESGDEEK